MTEFMKTVLRPCTKTAMCTFVSQLQKALKSQWNVVYNSFLTGVQKGQQNQRTKFDVLQSFYNKKFYNEFLIEAII